MGPHFPDESLVSKISEKHVFCTFGAVRTTRPLEGRNRSCYTVPAESSKIERVAWPVLAAHDACLRLAAVPVRRGAERVRLGVDVQPEDRVEVPDPRQRLHRLQQGHLPRKSSKTCPPPTKSDHNSNPGASHRGRGALCNPSTACMSLRREACPPMPDVPGSRARIVWNSLLVCASMQKLPPEPRRLRSCWSVVLRRSAKAPLPAANLPRPSLPFSSASLPRSDLGY